MARPSPCTRSRTRALTAVSAFSHRARIDRCGSGVGGRDPVWRDVVPITQFVQTSPVEGAPATEDTEVWIAYDSDNIYIAAYAHYTDTSTIRANRAERDETRGDDQVQVTFDPFLDRQRAYLFSVNGYAVPGDAIVNASGGGGGGGSSQSGFGIRGDSSWDALFEARASWSRTAGRPKWPSRSRVFVTRPVRPTSRTPGGSRSLGTSVTSRNRSCGFRSPATSPAN